MVARQRDWRANRDDRRVIRRTGNDRGRSWNQRRPDTRSNRDWQRSRSYQRHQNDRRYRDARRSYDRDHRRWDRNWRSNNRYDWHRYRARNRNIYRLGRYYSPYRNYSYRRIGIGLTLGSLFYSNRYWVNDPWQYRLPEVYGPYRWVRYYDDVLLVNIDTGQIVDVIYDFFW